MEAAMATDIRDNSITDLLSELSQESAGLIRQELGLMAADLAKQAGRVGVGAGFLGGAGLLGVGAFGALTAGLIAALGRRPARGAFMVAAVYGAGAGALAEVGVKRLGQVAPEAVGTIGRDVKAAAAGARGKAPAEALEDESPTKAVEDGPSPAKAVGDGKSATKALEGGKSPAKDKSPSKKSPAKAAEGGKSRAKPARPAA
jgi:hypothetical protein